MKPNLALIATGMLLLSTACSSEPSGSSSAAAASAADTTSVATSPGATNQAAEPPRGEDADRYCTITKRLEAAGEEAFAGLGREASAADYKAAERAFVLNNARLLDQLVAAAPGTLTPHVETLLAAMRQRGGLPAKHVEQRDATKAEKQVLAFEKKHC